MKKTNFLDFSGKKEARRGAVRIVAIIAAVLFFGIVSFVVILAVNDFSLDKFFGMRAETTVDSGTESDTQVSDVEDETSAPAFSDTEALNFLFLCHKNKKISFCTVISVSQKENIIRVKAISPDLNVNYSGKQQTLNDVFEATAAKGVISVMAERGIAISRYVICSETSFKLVMQRLGPVKITLERDLQYSSDSINYTLSKGEQTMTSDVLLKYMTSAAKGDELLKIQANTAATVIASHYTVFNIEKGEALFSDLVNLVDTDITAFDYANTVDALLKFIENSPRITAIS